MISAVATALGVATVAITLLSVRAAGSSLSYYSTPEEFAKFVADEHNFWGRKLKELKIEME